MANIMADQQCQPNGNTGSYIEEFKTVELILQSSTDTRGVDAFALTLIKAERQLRKLFTHLVYQFPYFGPSDILSLREVLGSERVYFNGFQRGFNAIYVRSLEDLIGARYQPLLKRLNEATEIRNKIFHGQLTSEYLSTEDLFAYVSDIREWCETLARNAWLGFQYDGFSRNSFRKSQVPKIWKQFRIQLDDVPAYSAFIRKHMLR